LSSAGPEDRRADANGSRAEPDGDIVIARHAHRQIGHASLARQLLQKREMRSGIFVERRNAHQTVDRQAMDLPAALDESRRVAWSDTGLLRLGTGVDLHIEFARHILLPHFL